MNGDRRNETKKIDRSKMGVPTVMMGPKYLGPRYIRIMGLRNLCLTYEVAGAGPVKVDKLMSPGA
jgi:hypothetical protein